MPLLKVKSLGELPPGSMVEIEHGDATYALCNVKGEIHCFDGLCPHAGGPLAEGNLIGDTVVCPWHAWEFDIRSGATDSDDEAKLAIFPVVVQNGDILVDLP